MTFELSIIAPYPRCTNPIIRGCMRSTGLEISSDPFMELEGRRVICKVDGQQIRGRLFSCRDGFITMQEDRTNPRITFNKYEIAA
jgi:hypothetical protein